MKFTASRHTYLEAAAARERGAPLAEGEPVPGCVCPICSGLVLVKHAVDANGIICPRCCGYRDLTRDAGSAHYVCFNCGTRSAVTWTHAAVGDELWGTLPRILLRPTRPRHSLYPALDVDAARRASIRETAARLGIIANRAGWAVCPFHADSSPSLHLNEKKRAAFCNPCGKSWDAIKLTMELAGLSFVDAVRELAA